MSPFLRVKSFDDEVHNAIDEFYGDEPETIITWMSKRLEERGEIINEISCELAEVRLNYEEVLRRLNKYEPTEELPERQYKHDGVSIG